MAVPTAVTIPSRVATGGSAHAPFEFAAAPTSPTAITWMPGDILLAYNSSTDTAYDVAIESNSVNSRDAEAVTITNMAFGTYEVFKRFPSQDDSTLLVSAENAAVKFARLSTRAQPA